MDFELQRNNDPKLPNMTISSLIFSFYIQLNILMVFEMIKHGNKPVLAFKES